MYNNSIQKNSDNYDEIIKTYINLIENMTPIAAGTGKKCYDFGELVLLESSFPESSEIIKKLKQIKHLGINSYEILTQKEKSGNYYILETKVKGSPIQEYTPKTIYRKELTINDIKKNFQIEKQYVQQYLNRLKEISENYDHLKKFVIDYFKLSELGIFVDPSKTNNIYYDPNSGYSFLDLNIASFSIDKTVIFHYIFYMISWCQSNIFSENDILIEKFYLTTIINHLNNICLELGKNPTIYLKYFTGEPLISSVSKREEYRLKYAFDSEEDYIKEQIPSTPQKNI